MIANDLDRALDASKKLFGDFNAAALLHEVGPDFAQVRLGDRREGMFEHSWPMQESTSPHSAAGLHALSCQSRPPALRALRCRCPLLWQSTARPNGLKRAVRLAAARTLPTASSPGARWLRSEERRVGKEGRCPSGASQ